jgi:hypothetical protein
MIIYSVPPTRSVSHYYPLLSLLLHTLHSHRLENLKPYRGRYTSTAAMCLYLCLRRQRYSVRFRNYCYITVIMKERVAEGGRRGVKTEPKLQLIASRMNGVVSFCWVRDTATKRVHVAVANTFIQTWATKWG